MNHPKKNQPSTDPQLQPEGLYTYNSTLYNICQEEGIDLQFLSRNWVKRLQKDGQIRYIVGAKFDLNSAAANLVADDKYALYEALCYANVPVIEHALLYEFDNEASHVMHCNTMPYILGFFEHHNHDIVIKGNHGYGGRQVYRVTQPDQILPTLIEVFHQNYSASMCPFYHAKHEYRVILLDDEEQLSYMKSLPKGSQSWKFNLEQGGQAEPMPSVQHDEIVQLAQRAARAVGLRFCSVDIIEDQKGDFYVMEVNSGVMIQHYVDQHPEQADRAREIYRAAVRKMFEQD